MPFQFQKGDKDKPKTQKEINRELKAKERERKKKEKEEEEELIASLVVRLMEDPESQTFKMFIKYVTGKIKKAIKAQQDLGMFDTKLVELIESIV